MSGIKSRKTSGVRAKSPISRMSRSLKKKEHDRRVFLIARRLILAVIALAMLVVALVFLFASFMQPEKVVTTKIEGITADYYENYFYDRIKDYSNLGSYTESGFSRVTLRQLLLFDSERYANDASLLSKYCDTEATYVRIYPEEPFSKQDYHVDYHYACTF